MTSKTTDSAPHQGSNLRHDQKAIARFKEIEKVGLAPLLTPIEKCERLREAIEGAPHIYVKRDDYLGFLCGGNKLRKLEYVMAEVRKKRASTVVTVGSVQSNHARVLAMVCRRLGLDCVLVLNGEQPQPPTGNAYINSLLGATIHTVASRAERDIVMDEVARDLLKKGKRVYKVPLGASDAIGSMGLVGALKEVALQRQRMGVKFDAVVLASSSGGTQAGLEVGKRLFDQNSTKIIGVSPDDPSEEIVQRIAGIMRPMLTSLGLGSDIDPATLEVDDAQKGPGYCITTEQSLEATRLFREVEGILLDSCYTGKAAAALIDYCRKGRFNPHDHVLFWHTGGLVALFK
jgi:D-cysteine desulfhydrase family pyridoxal phosphate-dependent enzyme